MEFCDYSGCIDDGDTSEHAIMEVLDALKPYLATLYELGHEVLVIGEDYSGDNVVAVDD